MTDYSEIQRIVSHAEDCMYDVWHLLPKGDSRLEDVNKILAELENLHNSFAVDSKEQKENKLNNHFGGFEPLSKFPTIWSKRS